MKIFLTALIIVFSLQSLTKADNIRDFEMEGISIGDSALNLFEKKEILNEYTYYYKKRYAQFNSNKELDLYEILGIVIDLETENFTIVALKGEIKFLNSIEECQSLKKKAEKDFKNLFPNMKQLSEDTRHGADPSGKSIAYQTQLNFSDGSLIQIYCMDWSDELTEEKQWTDGLNISATDKNFANFLANEAYN